MQNKNISPIREIQEYLRALARADARLPLIAVDGVYGKETTAAVKGFQTLSGLPQTGDVDPITWDEIYVAFREQEKTRREPLAIAAFPSPSYQLMPKEQNRVVSFLKLMLNAISLQYANIAAVEQNEVYDEKTERTVREIQRAFGLEENGIVDRVTWDAIVTAFDTVSESNL